MSNIPATDNSQASKQAPKNQATTVYGGQSGAVNNYGEQTNNFNTIMSSVATCPTLPSAVICAGRDEERDTILASFHKKRPMNITTLLGMGGLGKTTLAKNLAYFAHEKNIFQVVIWIDVGPDRDLTQILKTLGKYGDSNYEPDYSAYLSNQARTAKDKLEYALTHACKCTFDSVLIILDDVWDKEAAEILTQAIPTHAKVLITTRLSEINQWLIHFKPTSIRLASMTRTNAKEMLREYLGDVEEAILEELGIALGGHPLALKLAVSRAQSEAEYSDELLPIILKRHIHQYCNELPEHASFAKVELEHGLDKDVNLTKSLSYSYNALPTEADRARFRALGVLANTSFQVDLLAAVWGLGKEHVGKEGLLPLLRSSILQKEDGLYRLHPLLGAYARAKLCEVAEKDVVFARYADHIIKIAEPFEDLPVEDWEVFDLDLPHIDEVGHRLTRLYREASEKPPKELLERLGHFVWNVSKYVIKRPVMINTESGNIWRGLDWLEVGIEVYRRLHQPNREATILCNIGVILDDLGENKEALRRYDQALTLVKDIEDRGHEATILHNIGSVYTNLGEKDQALRYYEQALSLRQAVSDQAGEAATLNNIGLVWFELEQYDKALEFHERALQLSGLVKDQSNEAATLNNLGLVWQARDIKEKALDYYQQALKLYRLLRDISGQVVSLNNIGSLFRESGENEKALSYYEEALPLARLVSDRRGLAKTFGNIGSIWYVRGETLKALTFYEQALLLHQETGAKWSEREVCFSIAVAHMTLGKVESAIAYLDQGVNLSAEINHPDLATDREKLKDIKRQYKESRSSTSTPDKVSELATLYRKRGEKAVRQKLLKENTPQPLIELLVLHVKTVGNTENSLPVKHLRKSGK